MASTSGIAPEGVIEQVYEAAFVPELWPSLLDKLSGLAGSSGAILISASPERIRFVGSDADVENTATGFFEAFPGINERMRRLLAAEHAGFLTDRDAFTPEELDTHPIFRDYLLPKGLGFGVATAIALPAGELAVIHCEGPRGNNAAAVAAVPALDRLRPHLARAALLSARLAFEQTRGAVDTLEMLGYAACACMADGAVLVANKAFEKEVGHWTTRRKDRVVLRDRFADMLLQSALATNAAAASGSVVLSVPLRAGKDGGPAVLHVVPVRRAARDIFGRAAVILVLTKPAETPADATPLLQLLFDLTATESRVAAGVAKGRTIEEIAAEDGKSLNTVRNQLRKVMDKTGCRRQADLILLLSQLVPW